jgi:hypothetical protein
MTLDSEDFTERDVEITLTLDSVNPALNRRVKLGLFRDLPAVPLHNQSGVTVVAVRLGRTGTASAFVLTKLFENLGKYGIDLVALIHRTPLPILDNKLVSAPRFNLSHHLFTTLSPAPRP